MTVTISFVENGKLDFYDPKTLRKEWYGSDVFRGEKMEFKDVVKASDYTLWLLCLDGEVATLPLRACKVL